MKIQQSEPAQHDSSMVQRMRKFWKQDHLCDVTLKSREGSKHRCHRVWLAAASKSLEALLCGPFQELDHISKPIEFAASAGVVAALLDHIYGGEPEITSEEAMELCLGYAVVVTTTAMHTFLCFCADGGCSRNCRIQVCFLRYFTC